MRRIDDDAAPEVDRLLATDVDAAGGAELIPVREVVRKRIRDRIEASLYASANCSACTSRYRRLINLRKLR